MIEVRTPTRLHFGLLAYSRDDRRQFGGAGLMIERPGVVVRARVAPAVRSGEFTGTGKMGDRAAEFARRFAAGLAARGGGAVLGGVAIDVLRVPRPHTGLGSGTQLGMAVAAALARLAGRDDLGPADLASLVGRGERSAIGAYGFFQGGFLVEGGKPARAAPGGLSPLLMRHPFPEAWRIVLIRPRALEGLAGARERAAFHAMSSIPEAATAEMCRLVLLGLTPALVDADLDAFGEALYELQQRVGACFAGAQGGIYAAPFLADIVAYLRGLGVRGVGQSSWGPTLYALAGDEESAERLATAVETRFGLAGRGEVLVTAADNRGASVRGKCEVRSAKDEV